MLLVDAGDQSVLLEADQIVAVGDAARSQGVNAEKLACGENALVRGGEVNAHTHLYSAFAPLGMPAPAEPPRNFLEILQKVWWKLDRLLDEKSLRASARLYLVEALLAGATSVIDHHESPAFIDGSLDVLADAAEELGVRLATGYGATERNGGREEGRAGLAECARFARANRRARVKPLVALHASFTVSDRTAAEAGDLARELNVPLHVHVAEDIADSLDAHGRGFAGVFQRLRALDALVPGSILAHGVDLDDSSVRDADENGLWLVQNPRSNKGNRVGWPYALSVSGHVALGTDGYPAAMHDEWLACADGMVEFADRRASASGEILAARRSAGRELASQVFGARLEEAPAPGATADLAVYESEEISRARLHTILHDPDLYRAHRKLHARDFTPRHVIVAGRVVVRDWRLVLADEAQIRGEAISEAARLWKRW